MQDREKKGNDRDTSHSGASVIRPLDRRIPAGPVRRCTVPVVFLSAFLAVILPNAARPQDPATEETRSCTDAEQHTVEPPARQGPAGQRTIYDGGLGYCDTPMLPDQKWRVHDRTRPDPRIVTPGTASTPEQIGKAPSDAVVLLDGTEATYREQWAGMPRWSGPPRRAARGGTPGRSNPPSRGGAPAADDDVAPESRPPEWTFENGYVTAVQGTGSIRTKEVFSGPLQIHVEWAANPEIINKSQLRSNSGILIMGRYEIQILDSHGNRTYSDGSAASIYGQYPPLVNASRKPGDWQTYDIIWEPPDFEHLRPAYVTLIHNGVIVQNHQALIGVPVHRRVAVYTPHDPEGPLVLQNHGERRNPLFRSIWVRKITGYDEPNAQ